MKCANIARRHCTMFADVRVLKNLFSRARRKKKKAEVQSKLFYVITKTINPLLTSSLRQIYSIALTMLTGVHKAGLWGKTPGRRLG